MSHHTYNGLPIEPEISPRETAAAIGLVNIDAGELQVATESLVAVLLDLPPCEQREFFQEILKDDEEMKTLRAALADAVKLIDQLKDGAKGQWSVDEVKRIEALRALSVF